MTDWISENRLLRSAIYIIAIAAIFAALKIGESIFAPLVLALTTGVILSPAMQFFERHHVPAVLGTTILLLVSALLFVGLIIFLGPLVGRAADQAPFIWRELHQSVSSISDALRGLNDMSENVADAISPDANGPKDPVDVPDAADALAFAPAVAGQALTFVGSLFFFLLSRNQIYSWAASALSESEKSKVLKSRFQNAEGMVAHYFLTIALINTGFGILVTIAMMSIGMPSPVFWGVAAMLMNFVVYIGPMIVAVFLLLSGVVVFDGPMVAAPVAIFVFLNVIEGQFVTPALIGRRLSLNPLLVFLSLVFWLWMWGPIGGIVAIPVVMWILVVAGMVEPQPDTNAAKDTRESYSS